MTRSKYCSHSSVIRRRRSSNIHIIPTMIMVSLFPQRFHSQFSCTVLTYHQFRSSARTNRSGRLQVENDVFEGLPVRQWRQSLHTYTGKSCIYCGKPSESIDHVLPRSRGGLSVTENCVPACLSCNGHKSDADAFDWYRRQRFYDPRRAMADRLGFVVGK